MKQIYFASTLMWGAAPAELIAMALRHRLGGIELWAQQVASCGISATAFGRQAAAQGLQVVVHAKSWDLNFASLNRGIREASRHALEQSVLIAQAAGANELTLHPPRTTLPALRGDAMEIGREQLALLLDFGERHGVSISMEVMEKLSKELVTTADEFAEFAGPLLPRLQATLDLAHCRSLAEFHSYQKLLPRISKIHISNKQGLRLHTPLDDGDFDIAALLPELTNLNVPLVVEGFDEGAQFEIITRNLKFLDAQEKKEEKFYEQKHIV